MSRLDNVRVSREAKRGCGYRQPRGLYLVAKGTSSPCGKLPLPLDICPTCSAGIKFSRAWTWIAPGTLFDEIECKLGVCSLCPLGPETDSPFGSVRRTLGDRAGLLWVGEKFYSPDEFLAEAHALGVSRRIPALPRDFKLGETWVFLAHIAALSKLCPACRGGKEIVEYETTRETACCGHRLISETEKGRPICTACGRFCKVTTKKGKPLRTKKCADCKATGVETGRGVFSIFKPSAIEYVVSFGPVYDVLDLQAERDRVRRTRDRRRRRDRDARSARDLAGPRRAVAGVVR